MKNILVFVIAVLIGINSCDAGRRNISKVKYGQSRKRYRQNNSRLVQATKWSGSSASINQKNDVFESPSIKPGVIYVKNDGKNKYAFAELPRRTPQEIKAWIKLNYRGVSVNYLSSDVAPRSDVWRHLIDEHKWFREQVQGLTMTEALYLHDAAHRKIYFPHRPVEDE